MNLMRYYKWKDIQSYDETGVMHNYLCMINSIELMSNRKLCVFDNIRAEILCSSPFAKFWKDLTNGKAMCYDPDCYASIILEDDCRMIETVNRKWLDFLYSLPVERRKCGYLTYDVRVRIKDDDQPILINLKLSPLELDSNGICHLILCILSRSVNKMSGNIYLKMNDTSLVYGFNIDKEKFFEIQSQLLTDRGYEILDRASRGKTEMQIAIELGICLDTVKSHKRKIFKSLGVANIKEAIQWLNNQKYLSKKTY